MKTKRKIQIKVVGKESTECIRIYDNLVRCNIYINGRTCVFWTTEANYKALTFDGVFTKRDSTGAVNTTNVFTEEESS